MIKNLLKLAMLVVACASWVSTAAPVDTKTVSWKGFDKHTFTLDGEKAFVVTPKKAAPGNPWIWRTSFPNYHAEVDLALLEKGFHVGFIDVVRMLGSDGALDKMDRFYTQVREQWQLAEKPALEPCSRGGLHAYRYAARRPERIACIFGDVPVMDLKSWPLSWPGAKRQVEDAKQYYGFKSIAELKAYKGNPVDLLAPIAKAKTPLRHVICLNDTVVPPEQNTLEAQRRLRKLGHDLEVVSIPSSAKANGHHFPAFAVEESVAFIVRNCLKTE